MNNTNINITPRRQRLLVVDDDFTSREFLRLVLEQSGYEVVAEDGGHSAQQQLLAAGFGAFDGVLLDQQMPGISGLELLGWLEGKAPDLSVIIVSAAGGKHLVTSALRGGAADFIEKPVNARQLRESVARAVALTQNRRRIQQVELAVKELGRAQQWMIQSQQAGGGLKVERYFHPKLEAGGDSFSQFKIGPDHYFCLLTDVSGHDLQAAYLSAYFQGVVRGMLQCGAAVADIFGSFNRYLIEEWNQSSRMAGTLAVNASVAACSVAIDLKLRSVSIFSCGTPVPVRVNAGGGASRVAEQGGCSLGWFPHFTEMPVGGVVAEDERFLLRTDGIDDLADKLGVDPLSIAYRLWCQRGQRGLPELNEADDDILLTIIQLPGGKADADFFFPVVLDQYRSGQDGGIDEWESAWRRSLRLAQPGLPEAAQNHLLTAARTAVLAGVAQAEARAGALKFQISIQPQQRKLRVWVAEAKGLEFDY